MLKFVIFIVAAFILYKLFIGDKKKKMETKKKESEKLAANGVMVKDPICGTYVSKDSEIRVREGEAVHNFCSYDCRDKFLKQIEEKETEKAS
ncbi:MAG: transcriptional regulator [Desulfovibrionales bacterium]